jgi:hypothetical protein
MIFAYAKGTGRPVARIVEGLLERNPGKFFYFGKPYVVNRSLRLGLFQKSDVVVNYGNSKLPNYLVKNSIVINQPEAVGKAVNKLHTLEALRDKVPTVEYTTSKEEAKNWLRTHEVDKIYCRTLLNSKKGKGIVIVNQPEFLVDAPLYTKGYDQTHEFRVYVFLGSVIDYVQKRKKRDVDVDLLIRNHDRGWIFAHNQIVIRRQIKELAVNAVEALGLHFGAVDVLAKFDPPINRSLIFKDAVVCEVNTAPGLSSNTTLDAYTKAFSCYL